MKQLMTVLAVLCAISLQSFRARAQTEIAFYPEAKSASVAALLRANGDFVPWPWGAEMPFPWSFVQGTWVAERGNFRSYYVFRAVKGEADDGLRQLEVLQMDPVTCKTLAHGVGIDRNKTVRAQMNATDGTVYRISLRAFDESTVTAAAAVTLKPVKGQLVVMSVNPFDQKEAVHLPLQQISNTLAFKCRVEE